MVATEPIVVRSLVCHAAVEMALRAFQSFVRCADRPIQFILHDDGSLREADVERLQTTLPGVTIVLRSQADAFVDPMLARFPISRAFRQRNPLALKMLDIPMLADGGEMACCDTDVLAFRPFCGLFDWPDAETTGVFMRDTQNAYALRPWHLLGRAGVALPSRVNTGLMLFRTSQHDLEFIEWFLGRQFSVYDRIPGWVEQTCWAALAHRGRCRLWDASQVRVVSDEGCLADPALVIGHFTSSVRRLWVLAETPIGELGSRVTVGTVPVEPLSATALGAEQIRRAAKRGRTWISRQAAGIVGS